MYDEDRPLTHPDLTPEEARARAIAAVLAEQAARTEARRQRQPRPTTTWRRVAALAVLSVAAFYVWFAAPAWLGPDAPPPIPAERVDAGLRLAIYVQAQQIQAFREARGRLPDVIEEAGEPLPNLRYQRIDARTFRIRGFSETGSVLYLSTDSLREFARDADRTLGIGP